MEEEGFCRAMPRSCHVSPAPRDERACRAPRLVRRYVRCLQCYVAVASPPPSPILRYVPASAHKARSVAMSPTPPPAASLAFVQFQSSSASASIRSRPAGERSATPFAISPPESAPGAATRRPIFCLPSAAYEYSASSFCHERHDAAILPPFFPSLLKA